MQNLILVFFFLAISFLSMAQESIDYIVVKTIIETGTTNLDSNQREKLKLKVSQIANDNGYSALEGQQDFILKANFQIYDKNIASGMTKMIVVSGELSLSIYANGSDIQFGQYSYGVSGSGSNERNAIINAFKKVLGNNKRIIDFFEKSKNKIVRYYKNNCSNILAEAKRDSSIQNYSKVIAELSRIPISLGECSNKVSDLLAKSYKKLQDKNCNKLLISARSSFSENDYTKGLELLTLVDPESKCFKEAAALVASIEGDVDEKEMREWNLQISKYKDDVELEKLRIEAIKEIGKAYLGRDTYELNYTENKYRTFLW